MCQAQEMGKGRPQTGMCQAYYKGSNDTSIVRIVKMSNLGSVGAHKTFGLADEEMAESGHF